MLRIQNLKKNLKKPLDNLERFCYNIDRKRARAQEREDIKMKHELKEFVKRYTKDCIKVEFELDELYQGKERFTEFWLDCVMPDLKYEALEYATEEEAKNIEETITPFIKEAIAEEFDRYAKKYF